MSDVTRPTEARPSSRYGATPSLSDNSLALDRRIDEICLQSGHPGRKNAAQAVLRALLPETGREIKGSMRSTQELLEASGYANRPKLFDELIRILDKELRLVTPTEPDAEMGARSASEDEPPDASLALRAPISGERGYRIETMKANEKYSGRNDHLKRLPRKHYVGQAFVHWSMTMEGRKTGWLSRSSITSFARSSHIAFRFGICAPVYCCMPDHIHLLWAGIASTSDQLLAARFFRKQMNIVLAKLGCRFQEEAYDRVLREEERQRSYSA